MTNIVKPIAGLHHVTAVVPNAKRTLAFYSDVLGLTMLCRTVDLDQPSVLQLFCGSDGEVMISFVIKGPDPNDVAPASRVNSLVFAVPEGSLSWWEKRLHQAKIVSFGRAWAFAEEYLCFSDPDGLSLAFVEERRPPRRQAPRTQFCRTAISRIRSIEVQTEAYAQTSKMLVDMLGFEDGGRDNAIIRLFDGPPERPFALDVLCARVGRREQNRPGIIRRIAWRVHDLGALKLQSAHLVAGGYAVPAMRNGPFFDEVAFSAPDGLKFALATDKPGLASLAIKPPGLSLPDWLEGRRDELEERFAQ